MFSGLMDNLMLGSFGDLLRTFALTVVIILVFIAIVVSTLVKRES
jgi:hypothetical protein